MTQRDLSAFEIDEFRSQKALEAIQGFVDEFERRQEAGELRRLVNGQEFNGGILEQVPEDFTEHELVEPCLDALGYNDPQRSEISNTDPQFRRQPARFPKVETKRPDYELRNVHDQLTCIVEVKAINRERVEDAGKATENIATYLADNTLCKHAQETPSGVLVGIATDGFRWVLWLKDLDTGEIHEDIIRTSILGPVKTIAGNGLLELPVGDEARHARIKAREQLQTELVASFSRENLVRQVTDKVDRVTV